MPVIQRIRRDVRCHVARGEQAPPRQSDLGGRARRGDVRSIGDNIREGGRKVELTETGDPDIVGGNLRGSPGVVGMGVRGGGVPRAESWGGVFGWTSTTWDRWGRVGPKRGWRPWVVVVPLVCWQVGVRWARPGGNHGVDLFFVLFFSYIAFSLPFFFFHARGHSISTRRSATELNNFAEGRRG